MGKILKIALGIFALLIVIGIIGAINAPRQPRTTGESSVNPGAVDYAPLGGAPVVTLAQFNRIKTGQSYAQVKSIVGVDGAVQSENKTDAIPGVMDAITTVMHGWQNPDGSGMNAMFQNDKLVQKSQFGLR